MIKSLTYSQSSTDMKCVPAIVFPFFSTSDEILIYVWLKQQQQQQISSRSLINY